MRAHHSVPIVDGSGRLLMLYALGVFAGVIALNVIFAT
jgi:hypothetical protein